MKSCLALATLFFAMPAATPAAETNSAIFQAGNRILFQGDSITDGARGRNHDPNHILGHSYAFLIAAKYGASLPERNLTFINRGISGNKVPDLLGRWQKDAIDLKPTVVSILIGVNDIWHPLLSTNPVVSVEQYEAGYDKLLAETVAALPDAKLILLEPFITPGRATSPKWEIWQEHTKKFQAVVAKLGAKYHAPVVKLQSVFDGADKRAPAEYWVWDGVHPTYAGNQLIADEWVRVAAATWPTAK
jgi:lysophospholipase L1-like esterase